LRDARTAASELFAIKVGADELYNRIRNPVAEGAPRIQGDLPTLGIRVSERTASRLLAQRSRPPSPTWRTFLANHVSALASMDFFTVRTVTVGCCSCSSCSHTTVAESSTSIAPRASDLGVDGPAAARNVPRRYGPARVVARPRHHLRRAGAPADSPVWVSGTWSRVP
jgi:hypothetical protein